MTNDNGSLVWLAKQRAKTLDQNLPNILKISIFIHPLLYILHEIYSPLKHLQYQILLSTRWLLRCIYEKTDLHSVLGDYEERVLNKMFWLKTSKKLTTLATLVYYILHIHMYISIYVYIYMCVCKGKQSDTGIYHWNVECGGNRATDSMALEWA